MTYDIHCAIAELKTLSIDSPFQPQLPDEQLINEYEQKIGFEFLDDYKTFLREASDVCVGMKSPLTITKEGNPFCEELAEILSEGRELGIPNEWLPICEINSGYYCILANGKIRFWSHNGTADESWPDLATWIKEVWIENR